MSRVRPVLVSLAVLLAAAPALAEEAKPRLVLMRLAAEGVLDAGQREVLDDALSTEVRNLGQHQVLSRVELESALGAEESRRFLDCGDAACLAQLAGDLRVAFVINGSVGQFGDLYVLNLKLVDLGQVKVTASATKKVPSSGDALLAALPTAVAELFGAPPPAASGAAEASAPTAESETDADSATAATAADSPAGSHVLGEAGFAEHQIEALAKHSVFVTPAAAETTARLLKRGYSHDDIQRFAIQHELFKKSPAEAETWALYYTAGLKVRGWPRFLKSKLSLTDYFNERQEGIGLEAAKWALLGVAGLNAITGAIFMTWDPRWETSSSSGSTTTTYEYRVLWQVNFAVAAGCIVGAVVCFIIDALDRGQVEAGFFERATKQEIIDTVEGARRAQLESAAPDVQWALGPWGDGKSSVGLGLSLRW